MAELASTVTPAPTEPMVTIKEAKQWERAEYKRGLEYGRLTAHPLYGMDPTARRVYEMQVNAFIDTHINTVSGSQYDQLRFALIAEEAGVTWNRRTLYKAMVDDSLGLFPGYWGESFLQSIGRLVAEGFVTVGPVEPGKNLLDGTMALTDKGRDKARYVTAHPLCKTVDSEHIQTWLKGGVKTQRRTKSIGSGKPRRIK